MANKGLAKGELNKFREDLLRSLDGYVRPAVSSNTYVSKSVAHDQHTRLATLFLSHLRATSSSGGNIKLTICESGHSVQLSLVARSEYVNGW